MAFSNVNKVAPIMKSLVSCYEIILTESLLKQKLQQLSNQKENSLKIFFKIHHTKLMIHSY